MNKILFKILFVTIIFGYLPQGGSIIKKITYVLFLVLIVINTKMILTSFFKEPKIMFITIVMITYVMIFKILYTNVVLDDIYALTLTVVNFYIFQSIKLKSKDIKRIIDISMYSAVIVSSFIIITLKGNYIIAINTIGEYFYNQKNSFSPILAISLIYMLYYIIYKNIRKDYLILTILGVINIVILQSRTNILMLIIIMLLMLFNKAIRSKNKYINIYMILVIIVSSLIIFKDKIINIFLDIFKVEYFMSISSNYGIFDKLTSGRIETYVEAFNNFTKNIFLGVKFESVFIKGYTMTKTGVHNLWLRGLFYGGIIYFILLITLCIEMINKVKKNNRNKIVKYIFVAMFFNSLLEPFSPFGPGTSYLLYWFILLKDNEESVSKK